MDASTLSYTPNQSSTGYILSSPIGKLNYSNNEFICYKLLFDVIDVDDDGRISYKEGNYFLLRTKIPRVSFILLSTSYSLLILILITIIITIRKHYYVHGVQYLKIKMMILF